MKHSISHTLPIETARKVARVAFDAYKKKFSEYNPTIDWKSDDEAKIGFNVKGMSIGGGIGLRPNAIDIDMKVPFAFKLFEKKAVSVVESEFRKWIGRAERGELIEDGEDDAQA